MNHNSIVFSLRPATKDDIAFMSYIRVKTMKPIFENTLGWNEIDEFEKATDYLEYAKIIMVDKKSIGVIKVIPKNEELHLHQIQILPEFHKHGVGTKLIHQTIERAEKLQKPLTLFVVKNTPAMHLYQLLGFVFSDEFQYHYKMSKTPTKSHKEDSGKPKL